jgi:uncharacterized protein (DUF1684 family)
MQFSIHASGWVRKSVNMASNYTELLDYRRQVSSLYAWLRVSELGPEARLQEFRRRRDRLFASHSQSALDPEQKSSFMGLEYYPYNPGLRFVLPVDPVEKNVIEVELEEDGPTRMERFGRIRFTVEGKEVYLSLYWILGYGGGVFLPFRDATNRNETYGGGRYLLDTIKSADLGREGSGLVIDFNYAYNPSCAYNPRWHCPLAPRENWLAVPIRAGELRFEEE